MVFWGWIIQSGVWVTFLCLVGGFFIYLAKIFIPKHIEYKFTEKADTFRSQLKKNETEIDQLRSFLVSSQREINLALQAKRMAAAESLLVELKILSKFDVAVELMKTLTTKEIFEKIKDNNIFFKKLSKSLNIEENIISLSNHEKSYYDIYLSEKTIIYYNAYFHIKIYPAMIIKLFSENIPDKASLINHKSLQKTVIDLFPHAKEGFEKYGDGHAFYYLPTIYNKLIEQIRFDISGKYDHDDNMQFMMQTCMDINEVQASLKENFKAAGISDETIDNAIKTINSNKNI